MDDKKLDLDARALVSIDGKPCIVDWESFISRIDAGLGIETIVSVIVDGECDDVQFKTLEFEILDKETATEAGQWLLDEADAALVFGRRDYSSGLLLKYLLDDYDLAASNEYTPCSPRSVGGKWGYRRFVGSEFSSAEFHGLEVI